MYPGRPETEVWTEPMKRVHAALNQICVDGSGTVSIRTLGDRLGLSYSTTYFTLTRLAKYGVITWTCRRGTHGDSVFTVVWRSGGPG